MMRLFPSLECACEQPAQLDTTITVVDWSWRKVDSCVNSNRGTQTKNATSCRNTWDCAKCSPHCKDLSPVRRRLKPCSESDCPEAEINSAVTRFIDYHYVAVFINYIQMHPLK